MRVKFVNIKTEEIELDVDRNDLPSDIFQVDTKINFGDKIFRVCGATYIINAKSDRIGIIVSCKVDIVEGNIKREGKKKSHVANSDSSDK